MLAGLSKLDDLLPDQLSHPIFRGHRELKLGAHSLKGPVHGLNVLGLEGKSAGSRSWHRGATDL
jgi:hypothetical protein